ncbi:MAG: wax ester/triacylglycerol synthase family O-acyltransferase [Proteobacteria bacterium]|nr:wax ester/triacylglycerol synthase family O-acyltransferase [Pseudomonadota bacterium]
MQQLSGMDAAFLAAETPTWQTHVASVTLFDPSGVEGGYRVERLKETLRSRLHLIPPLRWRLVETPLGLGLPYWIEDPDFDMDYHVRRIAVPSSGGRRELAELASEIYRRRMDRRRPLWEWWVIEGLEDGCVAGLFKIHHAYMDGVTGVAMQDVLFDSEPDAPPVPPPPPDERWTPERVPGDFELLARSLPFFLGTPLRTLRNAASMLGSLRGRSSGGEEASAGMPMRVPPTSFNQVITQHRSFAYTSVSLSDVKRVKNAFGTKVNDVVLAICSGALRSYLQRRGELPAESLIASVPVNIRPDTSPAHGNQISGMTASLATEIADPVERLRRIHASTQASKLMHEAMGADMLTRLVDTPPPMLLSLAVRFYASSQLGNRVRPPYNLVISNVPGPPTTFYHLGAEVKGVYSMGICFDGAGLYIGLMSHRGQIDFGLLACRELVPDPWFIADGIERSLGELVTAAGADEESEPE